LAPYYTWVHYNRIQGTFERDSELLYLTALVEKDENMLQVVD
jgi:hypothetical protein